MIFKRVIIFFMLLDNLLVQGLNKVFPHRYKIIGKCRKCGKCCEEIHLKLSARQMDSDIFRELTIRWLSWLYGFIYLRPDHRRNYLIFSCRHCGKDGSCLNYLFRPNVCRNYPLLDYFEKPVFLEGCGFKAAD